MKITKTYATVHIRHMKDSLPFYEQLTGQLVEKQWESVELGLEFAIVGSFVLVAGSEQALALVEGIHHIFYVDSILEFQEFFAAKGVERIRGPITNEAGTLIVVRYPDGQIQEYLEPHAE